jgi:hypothetical protein
MAVQKQKGGSCGSGVCGLQLGGSKTKHSRKTKTKKTKKSKKQSGRGCGCGVGGSKHKKRH